MENIVEAKRKTTPKYTAEAHERAVRLVFEHRWEYTTQWEALQSITAKMGCSREMLRSRIRQAESARGLYAAPKTQQQDCILELEGEILELHQTNEILRKTSAYFAQAEHDCRPKR